MKRLLLILALLSVPSWAVIARTGSCPATTGTSCTFSATATGDLKIIFAFHTNSTVIPSLPAGWTTIDSVATASGGTPGAMRIGCNDSSSSGDTGSGTWTNATSVVGMSYSGTAVTSTGSCNTVGIGGFAHNSAKTSTALNFPVLKMSNQANTSWIAGLAGDSASSTCTPANMASVSATATIIGNDSNATATSWPSTNCTVSSSTWVSAVVEVTIAPATGSASIPTIIQSVSGWGTNSAITANGFYYMQLPNVSKAGNTLVLMGMSNTSVGTMTVIDDQTNTWTAVPNATCTGTNSQQVYIFVATNIAANTRQVKIKTTSGTADRLQAELFEVNNVDTTNPVDVANCTSATATAAASGTISPAFTNDALFQIVATTNWLSSSGSTSYTPGSGFAQIGYASVLADGGVDGFIASQWEVYSTTTPFNPAITQSGSLAYASAVVGLKAASAGATASGFRIVAINHLDLGFAAGSHTDHFPCTSGSASHMLLVMAVIGSGTYDWTALTDSNSNSWTRLTSNGSKISYAQNATCTSNMTVSWTDVNGSSSSTILLYEIAGAAQSSVLDTSNTSSGNQTVAGNLTLGTLTPAAAGEIVITNVSLTQNTVNGQASSPAILMDNFWYDGEDGTDSTCDRNNGWFHYLTPNTTTITPITTMVNGAVGVAQWGASIAAFIPAAGGVVRHRASVITQ